MSADDSDNKAFCALAWLHFHAMPTGRATLCCQSHETLNDETGQPYSVKSHTLAEIWNSTAMRETRRKMRAGAPLSACNACYQNEQNGDRKSVV